MPIDSLYRIRESQRVFTDKPKTLRATVIIEHLLSSVKLSCQDQRTQTFSETAKILQTTEPISVRYFFEVCYSAQDKRTLG